MDNMRLEKSYRMWGTALEAGLDRFVLEVPAGTSRLLGIGPGDVVRHEAIGNAPDSGNVNGYEAVPLRPFTLFVGTLCTG